MKNPSPFIPEGSLQDQKNSSHARVRLAVYLVIFIHVAGLITLLMQGCRRQEETAPIDSTAATNNEIAPFNSSNQIPVVSAPPETNVYVPPVNSAPPANQEYVVVKGDTLSAIAKKFNVSLKAIQDANP